MPGIEESEFHQLVRLHVGDHLDPGLLVRRAAGREVVLEDLLERLAHHRPAVGDAEGFFEVVDVLLGGGRGDSVDHRVRERHLLLNPVREGSIAHSRIADEGTAGDVAVGLDVVAGAAIVNGSWPAISPSLQGGGDQAE